MDIGHTGHMLIKIAYVMTNNIILTVIMFKLIR